MGSGSTLAGQVRWITAPSTWGGLVGAALVVAYAALTLPLPESRRLTFFGLVAAGAILATLIGDARERRALATLRLLGDKPAALTSETLAAALREVHRFPTVTFWVNIAGWCGGSLAIALVFFGFPEVSAGLALRIVVLGGGLGPVTALLIHLLILRRCRTVMTRLVELASSPHEVVRALPGGRDGTRRRLLLFTAIAVLTPNLVVLDVALTRTIRSIESALTVADPAEQRARLEAAREVVDLAPWALAAGLVVLVLGTSWLYGASLAGPLRVLAEQAERAAGGDLSRIGVVPADDELWAVSSAFTLLQLEIQGTLAELGQAGERLSETTRGLAATSTRQETGVAEQSAGLTETSATTEELARSAEQIAGNATQVASTAELTLSAARAGEHGAKQFLAAMRRLKDENQVIADAVLRLNKRVQQIGKVVDFISEIADKADLLALNAELEGTKAGEVGRGFSLVAAEMRRLAESVLRSTRAITQLIDEIRDATNSAVMATEAGVKTTEGGAALAIALTDNLRRILDLAGQTSTASQAISLATQQQKLGTEELARTMTEILRVTETNADATRDMVAANSGLSTLSAELRQVVGQMRTT